ncbi:MAG: hypothetical protein KDK66_08005 [Deltaproteobacteria bacterium]|nr:hypothetical protein [Deltaproteobacteria bacterium]
MKAYTVYEGKDHYLTGLYLQKGDSSAGEIKKDEQGKWTLNIRPFKADTVEQLKKEMDSVYEFMVYKGKIYFVDFVGCGWEGDCEIFYQANLDGSDKKVLLASCDNIRLRSFFAYKDLDYILAEEWSSALGAHTTWAFGVSKGEPMLRAPGHVEAFAKDSVKICPQTDIEDQEGLECYSLSWQNMAEATLPPKVKKGALLPIEATTVKDQVTFWQEKGLGYMICSTFKDPAELASALKANTIIKTSIPKKDTSLAVLQACDEQNYLVYYEGNFGVVASKDLAGSEINAKKNRFRSGD